MGLITRTRIGVRPIGVGSAPNAWTFGGSDAGCTLAGAPTWPLWPGGVRYVQSESLKAIRLFLAGYQLPAAGLTPATALISQSRKPPMTIETPMFPPRAESLDSFFLPTRRRTA